MSTPAGQRHKVICILGHMDSGPKEEWLDLADRIQAALGVQPSLFPGPRVKDAVLKVVGRILIKQIEPGEVAYLPCVSTARA